MIYLSQRVSRWMDWYLLVTIDEKVSIRANRWGREKRCVGWKVGERGIYVSELRTGPYFGTRIWENQSIARCVRATSESLCVDSWWTVGMHVLVIFDSEDGLAKHQPNTEYGPKHWSFLHNFYTETFPYLGAPWRRPSLAFKFMSPKFVATHDYHPRSKDSLMGKICSKSRQDRWPRKTKLLAPRNRHITSLLVWSSWRLGHFSKL